MSIIFSLMFTDTIIAILPSQVVSLLRLKHNMKAEVCQLTGCDYIVSNRMAVKRKTASGNLFVVSAFCENHLRRVTALRLCEKLRKKFVQKKFVKPRRRARLIYSRGNQMLYERVYLRTLALYFLLFNYFFVWVAWSASYSKTLLFYSEVSLIWPPET